MPTDGRTSGQSSSIEATFAGTDTLITKEPFLPSVMLFSFESLRRTVFTMFRNNYPGALTFLASKPCSARALSGRTPSLPPMRPPSRPTKRRCLFFYRKSRRMNLIPTKTLSDTCGYLRGFLCVEAVQEGGMPRLEGTSRVEGALCRECINSPRAFYGQERPLPLPPGRCHPR